MATGKAEHFARGERAYILLPPDFIPIYIGERAGSVSYKNAIALSALKRASLGLPPVDISQIVPPPEEPKREWRDYRGTSQKTHQTSRSSKNNPYVCNHCAYRSTRYSNMVAHLEKVHGDYSTDPKNKSVT